MKRDFRWGIFAVGFLLIITCIGIATNTGIGGQDGRYMPQDKENAVSLSIIQDSELSVDYIDSRTLCDYSNHTEIDAGLGSIYSSDIIVSSNQTISDIRLWKIVQDVNNDNCNVYQEDKCLGYVAEITENNPLVIKNVLFNEVMPELGISFVNSWGTEEHYYINVDEGQKNILLTAYVAEDIDSNGMILSAKDYAKIEKKYRIVVGSICGVVHFAKGLLDYTVSRCERIGIL